MTHFEHELQTSEAAEILRVGRRTVHRWATDGTLPTSRKLNGKLGGYRFRESDVRSLAAQRRRELEQKLAAMGGAA